ncbi:MAG: hydantoinase B/oxoprolinase family protein [Acidimicrobiales bacterium]|nr:hydantoinase B/oxoprolinase family protein [Acidimicrobiales bacterium]
MAVDPITFEVVRNGLMSLAAEVESAVKRSGGGAVDLAAGVCDASGTLVSQGESIIPVQLGALPVSLKATFQSIPPEAMEPGDVIMSNDPYAAGSNHLNDVLLAMPVYFEGERVSFIGARAHWSDVGGAFPMGVEVYTVREIYAEGCRIPPVRIYRRGEFQQDLWELIKLNMRNPRQRDWDLATLYRACLAGRRQVEKLCTRYGRAMYEECLGMAIDYTERRMRRGIAEIPDGTYEAEDWIEIDGVRDTPLRIAAAVAVQGESLQVDLSGCDQAVKAGLNSSWASAYAMLLYAIRGIVGTDIPFNGGVERVMTIDVPAGVCINPIPPLPCGGNAGIAEIASRFADVVVACLAQAVPDRALAGCSSSSTLHIHGTSLDDQPGSDRRGAGVLVGIEVHRGGYGASAAGDGASGSASHIGNTPMQQAENMESWGPVRILSTEIIPDSGGPGRNRGGFGVRRTYEILDDVEISVMEGRTRTPAHGILGGGAGRRGRVTIARPGREPFETRWADTMIPTPAGTIVTIETAGGGGYGPAWARPMETVQREVQLGYITAAHAAECYGVVIDSSGILDASATEERRRGLEQKPVRPIDRGDGAYQSIDPELRHRWSRNSGSTA